MSFGWVVSLGLCDPSSIMSMSLFSLTCIALLFSCLFGSH